MRDLPASAAQWAAAHRYCCWAPDLADHRDFWPGHRPVATLLRKLPAGAERSLPPQIDWRDDGPPVEQEAGQTTSTTHACLALIEIFERRISGQRLALSRRFVEYNARRQATSRKECGLTLRTALKVIRRCGAPPEEFLPSDQAVCHELPDAFSYTFQRDFRPLVYLRLDDRQSSGDEVLQRLRAFLAAGFPLAMGFPLHRSLPGDGEIAFPTRQDAVVGGQAVVAVGYHDRLRIGSDRGAILFRNSLGSQWGDGGHGWLSYRYVTRRLATDFWTLIKRSWLRSGELQRPLLDK